MMSEWFSSLSHSHCTVVLERGTAVRVGNLADDVGSCLLHHGTLRCKSYASVWVRFDGQYAFYHVPFTSGLRGWQWMMITVGLISFTASIITWFFLPDSPTRARFLTEDEKKKYVERVRRNDQGLKNLTFKKAQAMEAIRDPFSWMLFMLAINQTLVVGGINTFNALLINKAFNFSVTDSQLLSIPLGAMVIITYQLMA
jgi:sugar phosphate permease